MIELTEEQQAVIARGLELRLKRLRARRLLAEAPDLVAHILAQVAPSGSGELGMRVSGGEKAPLPLNTRALEDANSLYAQLVNWTVNHSRVLGIMAPASVLGWLTLDRDCDGFPSWAGEVESAALVRAVTDWLTTAEHRIENLRVAETYWDDVIGIIRPLLGRYRREPRKPPFASRSCPVCDRRTVIVDLDGWDTLGYPEELDYGRTVITAACTWCGQVIPSAAAVKYLEEEDAKKRKLEATW